MPKKFTEYIPGQTPLDLNEIEGLIPEHIALLSELNELEQANITKAIRKYLNGRKKNWDLTDPLVLRKIHSDMFADVWNWAGKFRKTEKNIGVAPENISSEFNKACGDLEFWQRNKTYSHEETAVRIHHRLVSIHPFPNGNGRFSRLIADIYLRKHSCKPFTWGGNLLTEGKNRKEYLKALKEADEKDFFSLIKIARLL